MIAQIVSGRTRPDSRYVITGDMNDPPSSPCLAPFVDSSELRLRNALADPVETRAARPDDPPPPGPAWTHRFKESGQPADYELFDHIWLSEPLGGRQDGAWIVRRRTHGGQGSDHDPAIARLAI